MTSHMKAAMAYAFTVVALVAISFGPLVGWQYSAASIALALGAIIIFAPTGGKQ